MTNEPKITTEDIKELLLLVQEDREAKKVFLSMPREEQLLAILGISAYNSSRLAHVEKSIIELREDNAGLRKELRTSRANREKMEKELAGKLDLHFEHNDEEMSTTEKVQAVISRQYGGVAKFLLDIFKGVLQTIITLVTLAILYMAFGGKIPGTP